MKQQDFIFRCKGCAAVASVTMDPNGWTVSKFRQGINMELAHSAKSGNIMLSTTGPTSNDTRIITDDELIDVLIKAEQMLN